MTDRPRTVAVSMVRDEEDIVGGTVAHLLDEVDHVIVADNLSTDATREILEELAAGADGRLSIFDDPDPRYMQSAKMTALARAARLAWAAEWIVPFDADEYWYSPFGRIADVLAEIAEQWLVVPAPLYDHVATGLDADDELDPLERLGWRRRQPNPLPKVACRWRPDLVIGQGNHHAYYRGGATRYDPVLVVRHFPYRSPVQFVRKVRNGSAAYRAAGDELPASLGAHWRQWGDLLDAEGEGAVVDVFRTWYWRGNPTRALDVEGETLPPLMFDPVANIHESSTLEISQ